MYDKKIRNKVLLLIVFIVILVVFDMIFYSKFLYNERSYYTESYLEGSEKYELDGNVVIEQTFIANKNNLEAVAIGFDKAFRTYSNDEIKKVDGSEDEIKAGQEKVQKLTDQYVKIIDQLTKEKENDLMTV